MLTHRLKHTLLIASSLIILVFTGHYAAAQTLKYHYDVLGRLTFVEDPTNGNRDYDYDAAGNRLLVATAGATDAANEPTASCSTSSGVPASPTNLAVSLSGSLYISQWGASQGASHYLLNFDRSAPKQIPASSCGTHSSTDSIRPLNVQACNSAGCSSPSNF